MNKSINDLVRIGSAESRLIIGLMSGTSLDGLDIALCEFSGSGLGTQVNVIQYKTVSYNSTLKSALKLISSKQTVFLEDVTLLNDYLGDFYADIVLECLEDWSVDVKDVDLIASHGQTIYHAPKTQHGKEQYPNATLQIGDGDHIAFKTGIITVSDFRQKHIAAGGEGAPLSVYGDYLLFSDEHEHRVLLNIGGISNFTYLPATKSKEAVLSTDVGPGNTLMDQFVQRQFTGHAYDSDGLIASQGAVNRLLLDQLLKDSFFDRSYPKTTGPEVFSLNYLDEIMKDKRLAGISDEDILATLSAFTVSGIVSGIHHCIPIGISFSLYLSGGGMHNTFLVKQLEEQLGIIVQSTAELNIDPDAKEAVLFALLANECIGREGNNYPITSGLLSVAMGKISLPR
ncbi:MAG: anhydro-N-acetylmuramic acid kinase [Pedobacter sp.]|nr:MAG: anhydro-N-acetylmuramic acid kinase [Pedobacter sp.]